MSQSAKRGTREIEEIREESEHEVSEIVSQLKRPRRSPESERLIPSILGWKVNCPHCSVGFIVKYADDGTYELIVEA